MVESGIPTVYRRRQYRSRLEARWAAFFDLLGWRYEYEPFDLAGWIPDFLLIGRSEVLVEVKPVVDFPWDVAADINHSGSEHDVLYLGCTNPIRPVDSECDDGPLGWFHRPSTEEWFVTDAFLIDYSVLPRFRNSLPARYGLCGRYGPSLDRISGKTCPPSKWTWAQDSERWSWVHAGNLSQWRGKQSVTS